GVSMATCSWHDLVLNGLCSAVLEDGPAGDSPTGRRDISPAVIRGLDPRIHLTFKRVLRRRWIAGSIPAMTNSVSLLLQFRQRRTIQHLASGAFEQIEGVGLDRKRPALAR